MKIRQDSDDDSDVTISLTPMIDVVFQLLIFFMLATNYVVVEKEMGVELPQAQSGAEAKVEPEELVINVFKDGRVVVSGHSVDDTALAGTLEGAAARDRKTPVTIRGDKDVNHGKIVGVMDACGIAGLTNLMIGTLDEGS